MTLPFTYLIKCIPTNQFYYGVKYSKNCHPNDLWTSYFTSSKYVRSLIDKHGKNAFEFQIRKTFKSPKKAKIWESKVLQKLKVSKRDDFINKYDFVAYDLKTRCWMNNGIQSSFVDTILIDEYVSNGWVKGRLFSPEHKKKISDKKKIQNSGENNPMFGRKHSTESILKNIQSNKDNYKDPNFKNGMQGKKHTKESRLKMSKAKIRTQP